MLLSYKALGFSAGHLDLTCPDIRWSWLGFFLSFELVYISKKKKKLEDCSISFVNEPWLR